MREPKILFFDIETTPLVGYTWGLWNQNVIRVEEDWHLLCFSYSWGEGGEVQCVSQPDFPRAYARNRKDDRQVTQELWKLLDEADVVVGHNVRAFDVKKANARFMLHGMAKPSPFDSIDTLTTLRKEAKNTSNRLDSIGQSFGLGGKEKHSGFDTWLGCMAGREDSWEEMTRYAIKDTVLLQDVFKRLKYGGWLSGPNMALLSDIPDGCPNCGDHRNMVRRGTRFAKTIAYQRYQCSTCKKYSRERKSGTGPRFT